MLGKENRITKKKDFEKIFKKGTGFKERFLILKTVSNNSQANRFAFIASQKVSKKAVVRNKIRRRLRELVRARLDKMKKGFDSVLIVLPGLEKKDFSEVEKTLDSLLKKAKLT